MSIAGNNLKAIRAKRNLRQEDMGNILGVGRAMIINYEKGNDSSLDVGKLTRLQEYMRNDPILYPYSFFDVTTFNTEPLDLTSAPAAPTAVATSLFKGAYLAYYYDNSDIHATPDENEPQEIRPRQRYLVMYLASNGQPTPIPTLSVFATPFKDVDKAADFLHRLNDTFPVISPVNAAGKTDATYKDELAAFFREETASNGGAPSDYDYYTGFAEFFGDAHFRIELTNRAGSDRVSVLFVQPPQHHEDRRYYGGLGLMSSVGRGKSPLPVAQKLLLARDKLICSTERIDEHLCLSVSDIPVKNEFKNLIQMHRELEKAQSQLFLTQDDCDQILLQKIKQLLDQYNTKQNRCGFVLGRDDDNRVYHMLKRNLPEDNA